MDSPKTIDEWLSKRKKSQKELAEAIKIKEKTFSAKKVNGSFDDDQIKEIADFLEINPSDILLARDLNFDTEWKDKEIAFLKEQNEFYKEQIADLKRRLDVSSNELNQHVKVNQAYLKTIFQQIQLHRSAMEKVPLKRMQSDMDKLLASHVEGTLKMDR